MKECDVSVKVCDVSEKEWKLHTPIPSHSHALLHTPSSPSIPSHSPPISSLTLRFLPFLHIHIPFLHPHNSFLDTPIGMGCECEEMRRSGSVEEWECEGMWERDNGSRRYHGMSGAMKPYNQWKREIQRKTENQWKREIQRKTETTAIQWNERCDETI